MQELAPTTQQLAAGVQHVEEPQQEQQQLAANGWRQVQREPPRRTPATQLEPSPLPNGQQDTQGPAGELQQEQEEEQEEEPAGRQGSEEQPPQLQQVQIKPDPEQMEAEAAAWEQQLAQQAQQTQPQGTQRRSQRRRSARQLAAEGGSAMDTDGMAEEGEEEGQQEDGQDEDYQEDQDEEEEEEEEESDIDETVYAPPKTSLLPAVVPVVEADAAQGLTELAVPSAAMGDLLAAYNTLRAFSWQLRISPFSFPDFVAAMAAQQVGWGLRRACCTVWRQQR